MSESWNGASLQKSSVTAGNLLLHWQPSCSSNVSDYAIYEGTIGSWYSHTMIDDCTDDGGDLVEEIAPRAADSYYLIVPLSQTREGSYGLDSNGTERPAPPNTADRCLDLQAIGGC